jgi:RimJ/RimL family protein N-acetyltransferase
VSEVPVLETLRLLVRPFRLDDLEAVHRLLDVDLRESALQSEAADTLAERRQWLEWTVLNYEQLARLRQPPYGDRAIALKSTHHLIGACGFVPCLNVFEQLPAFATGSTPEGPGRYSTEFGLFYAISPVYQRRGYATEAAQALVDYAFSHLRLKRIVATTGYANAASIGVMRRLGMRIESNPRADPPWLQVVGVLEYSDWSGQRSSTPGGDKAI